MPSLFHRLARRAPPRACRKSSSTIVLEFSDVPGRQLGRPPLIAQLFLRQLRRRTGGAVRTELPAGLERPAALLAARRQALAARGAGEEVDATACWQPG